MNRILSLIGVVLVVGSLYWFSGGPPPDGPYETYHDNGQLMRKGIFRNGVQNGPFEYYHENGQLGLKMTYKDGMVDGPFEEYHDNGQVMMRGTFKDGSREGFV